MDSTRWSDDGLHQVEGGRVKGKRSKSNEMEAASNFSSTNFPNSKSEKF